MPTISSPINRSITLTGTSTPIRFQLYGVVLHESVQSAALPVPSAPVMQLSTRVLRSNKTGLLDFDYSLSVSGSDYDHELRVALNFGVPGVIVSFADFRCDGPGTIPPGYFESTVSEAAVFRFTYGLSVGRDSRQFLISTNAREFRESNATVSLICHNKKSVRFKVAGPLGLAPVMRTLPDVAEQKQQEPEPQTSNIEPTQPDQGTGVSTDS